MRFRRPENTETHKYCPKCATVKPRTEFHRNSVTCDGYQGYCGVCGNRAKYESIAKKRDYYRAMSRRHNKERRMRDPEAIKREKRRDYEKNRDRHARSREAWFAAHPDKRRQQRVIDKFRRRCRLANAFVEDVEPIVVWARDEGRCHICQEEVSFYKVTMDHVIPLSKGGKHSYDNIKTAHMDCNQWKHARMPDEVPELAPPEAQ